MLPLLRSRKEWRTLTEKPADSDHSLPIIEPKPNLKQNRLQHVRDFLNAEVAASTLLEIELMIIALAAGINDAVTYNDYHIFASNQTGNTVFLGIRALGLAVETIDLRNVCVSISLFIAGGFIFGQLGYYFGSIRRGWLFFTNTIQIILVFIAAALRKWYAIGRTFSELHNKTRFSISATLAFASGAQVAMARSTEIPEVTTAMVTSAYIDFLSDPKLFRLKNRPRDRRLVFVIALMGGSFIGATAYKYVEPAFAIFLAGLAKTIVLPLLFFNPVKEKRSQS